MLNQRTGEITSSFFLKKNIQHGKQHQQLKSPLHKKTFPIYKEWKGKQIKMFMQNLYNSDS